MDFRICIERIDNGFIVTSDGKKRFYESIAKIVECHITEEIREEDKRHSELDTYGENYSMEFKFERF